MLAPTQGVQDLWSRKRIDLMNYTTCSSLGMVEDDSAYAITNFDLLADALQNGKSIIVDKTYYIQVSSTQSLSNDVCLYGKNGGKLILNTAGTYFSLSGQELVYINNLFIESTTGVTGMTLLFTVSALARIEKFVFSNNHVSGTVSVCRHTGTITVDPSSTVYGYEHYIVENNKFSNTYFRLFETNDVPIGVMELRNNVLRNFQTCLMYSAIDNSHSYSDNMYEARKLFIVSGNDARNDDSFFYTTGYEANSYYCLAVIEGMELQYRNNHVEGIKTQTYLDVHDVVAYCYKVYCQNNIYKNNMNWRIGVTETTNDSYLMQSKSSSERYYINNIYIIEYSWLNSFSLDLSNVGVQLCTQESISQVYGKGDFVANGNEINVYKLIMLTGLKKFINNTWKNNTIKAEYAYGYLVSYDLSTGYDYTNASCAIENNTIDIKNIVSSETYSGLLHITRSDSSLKLENVIIKNNTITNAKTILIQGLYANRFIFCDNTLSVNTGTANLYPFYLIDASDIKSTGNVIRDNGYAIKGWTFSNVIGVDLYENNLFIGKYSNELFQIYIKPYDISAATNKYRAEYKIYSEVGTHNFIIEFEYGYNSTEDRNYVKFIRSSDSTEYIAYLNRCDGSDTYDVGQYQVLKFTEDNGAITGDVNFSLRNGTNYDYWEVTGFTDVDYVRAEIKRFSIPL